jgi:beta-N-acetylhexosaminidase
MTSVEGLALRCLLPGFEGAVAPDWVRRRAAQGLGGVVLFGRNVESDEQVRALTAVLHAERPELVIAIDEEGGDVTRLDARTGSRYPGNLALGAAGDLCLTAEVAAEMGARLADVGVDIDLAPVADVNTNPRNPIIGVRSFGSDSAAVAEHTAAWVRGMQGAGVAACAKHFPGHGDTEVDSHLALPVGKEELAPFKAAIGAGVKAIMSAHIVVPSIDHQPATISSRVMTGLLRDELGFEGVAVTDGLEMGALSGGRTLAQGAVLALAAGCDALCVGGGLRDEDVVDELIAAIVSAVNEGRLTEERLAQAALRIELLSSPLTGKSAAEPREGAAGLVAGRAIRVEGNVTVGDEAVVIRLGSPSSIAAGEVPWGMAGALAARGVRITERTGRLVIAVRDLHRQPENQARAASLLERHPDAVVVEMGVPICRPQAAKNYVATHGSARVCAEAAAAVMRP